MSASRSGERTIEALHDRVIIKRDVREEKKTYAGLIIPITTNEGRVAEATVYAVGPGRFDSGKFVETVVKPGQRVGFFTHAGTEADLPDGSKGLVLMESELLWVVKS